MQKLLAEKLQVLLRKGVFPGIRRIDVFNGTEWQAHNFEGLKEWDILQNRVMDLATTLFLKTSGFR